MKNHRLRNRIERIFLAKTQKIARMYELRKQSQLCVLAKEIKKFFSIESRCPFVFIRIASECTARSITLVFLYENMF